MIKWLLGLVVIAAIGALLYFNFSKKTAEAEKPAEAEKSRVSRSAAGEPVIKLDKETQERIALKTEPLAAASLHPQLAAFGRVMDPSPLVALDGEVSTAEAALESSKAAAERAKNLFQSGQNVAQKIVETAEAQFRADEIHVESLRRRMTLEWGEAFSSLEPGARRKLVNSLVKQESAFVRVEVGGGESVLENPVGAQVVVLGREDNPLKATAISPATAIEAKTQAQGFLLRIDAPEFPLRPGVAVTAYLELPGEASSGVLIPRAAVVRHDGETWVYVKTGDEEFTRREAHFEQPTEGGWFVKQGFNADENVVVAGAQSMLSEELKSQGGGGAD